MALIPEGLSFEAAAALPFAGTSGLHFMDVGQVGAGTKLLINGAAGAVGSAALQIAASRGAEVTAVCSAANHELVRSLGAGRVIDYRTEPIFAPGDAYDVVCDTQGKITPNEAAPAMVAGGRLLALVMRPTDLTQRPKGIKVIGGTAASTAAQMEAVCRLAAQGVLKPVIDGMFGFEQMPAAHARVDSGHKRGAVVVKIAP
jgi:NADPH:quinone reductase-like Zn-dependent oxidoreductase